MKKLKKLFLLLFFMNVFSLFSIGKQEKESLELWHWETPPARVAALEKLFTRFETESGIKVMQVPINFGEYQTKILAGLAAKKIPDLLFINPPQLSLFTNSGTAMSIDEIFKKINNTHGIPDALARPYRLKGTQFGIPIFGVYWPLTYRSDLFEKAGLKPPTTWQELLQVAEKLTLDIDKDGKTDVYGFCMPVSANGNYGSQVVWSFLRSNGGDIVQVRDGKEEIVFDSPQNVETFTFLSQLAQFSPPGKENLDWGATELLIKTGKVASVMYNGAWIRELDEKNPDLLSKYKMALMPKAPRGGPIHTGYPRALVVTKTAQPKWKAVERFFDWIYEPKNNAELLMMEGGLFMPTTKATAESNEFLSYPVISRNKDLITVQALVGNSINIIGFTSEEPSAFSSQLESSFILGKTLQKIVIENMSPSDAVKWGAEEYRKIITKR